MDLHLLPDYNVLRLQLDACLPRSYISHTCCMPFGWVDQSRVTAGVVLVIIYYACGGGGV